MSLYRWCEYLGCDGFHGQTGGECYLEDAMPFSCLLKCMRECSYTGKATTWVFLQCCQHHFFNLSWNIGNLFAQGCRRSQKMLRCYLIKRAAKGRTSGKPFVNDNSQCILITGCSGLTQHLFRSHIGCRSSCLPRNL